MKTLLSAALVLFLVLLSTVAVMAFPKEDCGEKQCIDCHSLSTEEATFLLDKQADRVLKVELSDMPGVWLVEIEKKGRKYPVYIDFAKGHVLQGELIRLKDGANLTQQRSADLNRVDAKGISLADALVIGKPKAPIRVIVFTDPQCHFCGKLHEEMKKVVKRDPDIAFFIKLFPLNIHPDAYMISKSIICHQSMQMLEDSLAGRPVPPPLCLAEAVDKNLELGRDLGVRSTPTLVLPDGRLLPGFKTAEVLMQLLKPGKAAPAGEAAQGPKGR